MSIIEILRARRSCRQFTDEPVAPATLAILEEALLRAPTSRNLEPWRFLVVQDRALITTLAAAKAHGSAFLAGAPLAVVICADEDVSDVWVEDCSIAATILQLTAQDLGLGSCWAQIRLRPHDEVTTAEEYVHTLLDVPASWRVASIIGLGHPAESRPGVDAAELSRDKLHRIG